eukprot:s1405_g10.t1
MALQCQVSQPERRVDSWTLPSMASSPVGHQSLSSLPGAYRWGEALHPGPVDQGLLHVSFSNPSGLRNKESAALALGDGIHSFAETQLSVITQRSCRASLKAQATQQNRQLRVHFGAPAPTRTNSVWAGSWTGVATLSDVASQEVQLPYAEERSCGRVLTTCHYLDSVSLLNAVVYGYPRGPTWPQARQLTAGLLQILTTELVLGATGPRIIGGDMNAGPEDLEVFDYWRSLGWVNAQDYAHHLWQQPKSFTCKQATERDLLWLSPEAAALCRWVEVSDHFADHSTVSVGLCLPSTLTSSLVWPRASAIPYDQVTPDWHQQACPPAWQDDAPVDQQWAQWARSFEDSLNGYVHGQPDQRLMNLQKGRLQRTAPLLRPSAKRLLKSSRPGEVVLRNTLLGSSVQQWFRQLRRLQSYVMASRNNKQTPAAIAYRLELWTSILSSPGFVGGFATWWHTHRADDSPPLRCPSLPPSYAIAQPMFDSFKLCFEKYEAWHLRQRGQLLKTKYDQGMTGLFQELRKQPRDRLDFLRTTTEYHILATEDTQCHVDQSLACHGCTFWQVNGQQVQPTFVNDVVLDVGIPCEAGDVLIQHQVTSSTAELHQALLDYWRPTWCTMATVSPEVWDRVFCFFQAYVPQFDFQLAPITVADWRRAQKRFKKQAARGVDGVSHVDLLNMPQVWTERLLALLNKIEVGEHAWPQAILYGVVCVIAKDFQACTVDRFRPIVVFSVIYRTWASIRSRQLLRLLGPHMDSHAYGFLPGCEPTQLWLTLQADVECAHQSAADLCGLSSDLVRAFNNIPRQHTFALAEHLGVPSLVLRPWKAFLDNCTRAFDIRGALSLAVTSTCGLPEGDAMSVYAMVQLNLAWHLYMKVFAPSVRALSFVDNLSLVATTTAALLHGFACLVDFFRLWNLMVDLHKSYCWATSSSLRTQLRTMPMQSVDSATELGGVLSFTRRRFTGLMAKKISSLEDKWFCLQKSWAPLRQKLAVLPLVMWASALHGIGGSCLGEGQVDALRKRALSALRLRKAGVNGLLRLSLSSTPTADPGFWRALQTFSTFRRMLRKEPRLMNLWKAFMFDYQGDLFSGPFSQLLTVATQLGWNLDPPFFYDHDSLCHHLLHIDRGTLEELLWDGWLQFVARQVQHRGTMRDLHGLDPQLVHSGKRTLNALDTALVGSLQSGAFISASSHCKFDKTKDGMCSRCLVEDTPAHWLVCPRFQSLRTGIHGWVDSASVDTEPLRLHLLPSRSPHLVAWKTALMNLVDETGTFFSSPSTSHQHVFTDGSTTRTNTPYELAAWACINASSGRVIAAGPVVGLRQTNDRAELSAALAVMAWQAKFGVDVDLWTDAKYVAEGISHILQHGDVGEDWSNEDLWLQILHFVQCLGNRCLVPHWIPSHLDDTLLTDPFEDWIHEWNDRVDHIAKSVNVDRPHSFQHLWQAAVSHHQAVDLRLRQLRAFYFGVAQSSLDSAPEIVVDAVDSFSSDTQFSLFHLYTCEVETLLSDPFDLSLASWLQEQVCSDAPVYNLSFEELVFLLISVQFRFPFWNAVTQSMDYATLCSRSSDFHG